MSASLTLFFIVEPPTYQYMACYLAASLRCHLPPDVQLVGYCPEHRMSDLDPAAVETLRRMHCEVRPFQSEGHFDPPYPHGNKLLACLEPRDTDFSGFMDSDILMLRQNSVDALIGEGQVRCSVAASMRWAPQTVWNDIYGAFGMEVPAERLRLMRDRREDVVPYFSSGFVTFPERHRNAEGKSFSQVWMDTAKRIDAIEGLENKRPYLDQMSLPVAIRRAGLSWSELPEEQHYILGGTIRGQALPEEREIFTVHYRKWDVLTESGLAADGYAALRQQVGARRVSWVPAQKLPPGIAPLAEPKPEPATVDPVVKAAAPDPSRADIAAVTMVHQDHFFLERWVRHYSAQIGRKNLYVLRHGLDPEIDRIAEGANIIHLPNPDDKSAFDRRRWVALPSFASSLTLYYNWVLCNDVDEIVAVDPAIAPDLPTYLRGKFADGSPARAISPFAVEIVHTPALEPEPIGEGPILGQRRSFRINSNYAKPCLIRGRTSFSIGGHGSTHENVELDPHLYLFHLRYVDEGMSRARLLDRKAWIERKNGPSEGKSRSTWDQGTSSFDALSRLTPVAEGIDFPEVRTAMVEGRTRADTGNWFYRSIRSSELYRLPERFSTLF